MVCFVRTCKATGGSLATTSALFCALAWHTRRIVCTKTVGRDELFARERYREGVGSIVDLLIAQSALANARAQSVDARWQWRTSLAQLAHDVGVLNARGDTSFSPLTPLPDIRPSR